MWPTIFTITGLLGSFIVVMTIAGKLTQESIEQTEAEWSARPKERKAECVRRKSDISNDQTLARLQYALFAIGGILIVYSMT